MSNLVVDVVGGVGFIPTFGRQHIPGRKGNQCGRGAGGGGRTNCGRQNILI